MNLTRRLNKPLFIFVAFQLLISQTFATEQTNVARAKGTHPLALALTKIGAFSCVERANQIGNFIGGKAGEVILFVLPGPRPGSQILHATLLVPSENSSYSTVEISLAPTASGCNASYETYVYFTKTCNTVMKKVYPNKTFTSIKNTGYSSLSLSKNARVLIHPIGSGCQLIKHELIY